MRRSSDSASATGVTPRRAGSTAMVLIDLLRHARLSQSWVPLILIVLIVVAAIVIFLGQTVAPWAIYPAL